MRVTDGMSIAAAFERSISEARVNQRELAAIGIDCTGAIAYGKTSEVLLAAYHNGEKMADTLE